MNTRSFGRTTQSPAHVNIKKFHNSLTEGVPNTVPYNCPHTLLCVEGVGTDGSRCHLQRLPTFYTDVYVVTRKTSVITLPHKVSGYTNRPLRPEVHSSPVSGTRGSDRTSDPPLYHSGHLPRGRKPSYSRSLQPGIRGRDRGYNPRQRVEIPESLIISRDFWSDRKRKQSE